ncbi:toxin-antitoxin system YwqK family antitoxin [Winogradskyella tangerina]|uniref:toxin-antitoxin system YwqK family antitoxin n=1 Tax=Winogradskyella tangerina TaxID=2023240 RepID=UPI000DBE9F2C|nr:toxin-antitoxin system YwqK family antitoxin [Winogradskyella tangerina]
MIKQKVYLVFIFTITLTLVSAQKSVNQYDKDGKRHGLWTKNYYQTDQKRYEGTFKHGKEIDTFKYYTLSDGKSVLSAIKVFNENDSLAKTTFYTSKKKIISEGMMNGKRYIGQWTYYHKNSPQKMIVENFNDDGKLEGERAVFYINGNIAEKANYLNGELNGKSEWFSEDNLMLRESVYKQGKLQGLTKNYDKKGLIASEGNYKDDKKAGIWKYYKNGKITKEIDHTNQKVIKKYE